MPIYSVHVSDFLVLRTSVCEMEKKGVLQQENVTPALKKESLRLMRRSGHLTCVCVDRVFFPATEKSDLKIAKKKKKEKKRKLISNRANITVTDHKRRCVESQMPLPCGKATHEKSKRQGKKELHDFFFN